MTPTVRKIEYNSNEVLTRDIGWVSAMVNIFPKNVIDSLYEEPLLPFGTLEPRRDTSPVSKIVIVSALASDKATTRLNGLNIDAFLSSDSISTGILLHLSSRMGSSPLFYEAQTATIAVNYEDSLAV